MRQWSRWLKCSPWWMPGGYLASIPCENGLSIFTIHRWPHYMLIYTAIDPVKGLLHEGTTEMCICYTNAGLLHQGSYPHGSVGLHQIMILSNIGLTL
jgi:hypothetical protein